MSRTISEVFKQHYDCTDASRNELNPRRKVLLLLMDRLPGECFIDFNRSNRIYLSAEDLYRIYQRVCRIDGQDEPAARFNGRELIFPDGLEELAEGKDADQQAVQRLWNRLGDNHV